MVEAHRGSRAIESREGFMKIRGFFSVFTALLIGLVSVSLAEAISITLAKVQNGLAVVEGNKTAKQAVITWENAAVTKTTSGGAFSFSGIVPSDCVGTLSDGTDT